MKKILFYILTMVLVLSSCSTKKYDEKLCKGFSVVSEIVAFSALVCDETSSTWSTAIYDNKDSHGRYCSDFNKALRILREDLEEVGVLDTISSKKNTLNTIAKELVKYPNSRKDAYNDFIELVTDVNSFADLAIDPEGSLTSYRADVNALASSIKKQMDAFELKYGDFLIQYIDKEESLEDDW